MRPAVNLSLHQQYFSINGIAITKGISSLKLERVLHSPPRVKRVSAQRQLIFFDEIGISAVVSDTDEVLMLRFRLGGAERPYLAKKVFPGSIANYLREKEESGIDSLLENDFFVGHPTGFVAFPSNNYVIWIGVHNNRPCYLGFEWEVAKTKAVLDS